MRESPKDPEWANLALPQSTTSVHSPVLRRIVRCHGPLYIAPPAIAAVYEIWHIPGARCIDAARLFPQHADRIDFPAACQRAGWDHGTLSTGFDLSSHQSRWGGRMFPLDAHWGAVRRNTDRA